jgi:hypothetical protein
MFNRDYKAQNKQSNSIIIDATETCQISYGAPMSRVASIGGRQTSSAEAKNKEQALIDWNRAASPGAGGGQEIFLTTEAGVISLKELLKEIYTEQEQKNPYGIIIKDSHHAFTTQVGLKKFFEDYLFPKVTDEEKRKALAEHAYVNLHQSGLGNTLNTLVYNNLAETKNTKTVRKPSSWKETYQPLPTGVMVENLQEFSTLFVENNFGDLEQKKRKDDLPYLQLQFNAQILTDEIKKESQPIKVENNIARAVITLLDEEVQDFELGRGFVKEYAQKEKMFDALYQEVNALDERKMENTKMNSLLDVIERFRHLELKDLAEVINFQKFISTKMAEVDDKEPTKPTFLRALSPKEKNNAYKVLEKLDDFISDQISLIIQTQQALQQEALKPPRTNTTKK